MKKYFPLLAALLCTAGCIYPYDPEVEPAPEGVLVVEGDILVGSSSTLSLGMMTSLYPVTALGDQPVDYPYDLTGARAWIEDEAGTVYEGTPVDAGSSYGWGWFPFQRQYTFATESAPADRKYRACVETLGARYSSDWALPLEAPVIRDIRFDANANSVIVNVSLDGGPESTGYALLSYDETWEFHTEYTLKYEVVPDIWIVQEPLFPVQQPNYWCWKHQDNYLMVPVDFTGRTEDGVTDYPLYTFPRTSDKNHRRYCVNVRARTINKETYRFLSHLDELADGGGDLFTPNPGEIQGNIRCETDPDRMALGYVTASRMSTRRAFLDSRYYRPTPPNYGALSFLLPKDYPQYYEEGFLPLVENPKTDFNPEIEGPYGWGAPRCYDCVAAGGTKERPDDWYEDL